MCVYLVNVPMFQSLSQNKIYVWFHVSVLKKTRYGRSALSFYIYILYLLLPFPPFSAYLTIFSTKFRIFCLRSGQKPRLDVET